MMNNRTNNRRTNNYRNNGNSNAPRRSREEYEQVKAAQIAQQSKNLEVIGAIASLLDNWLANGHQGHFSMKDILSELNKTYSVDETKTVSQYSYMLMELANARNNKYVSGDRINIRIMYIEERMKTSFKKELHEKAAEIISAYPTLFKWNNESDGKDYDVLGGSKE